MEEECFINRPVCVRQIGLLFYMAKRAVNVLLVNGKENYSYLEVKRDRLSLFKTYIFQGFLSGAAVRHYWIFIFLKKIDNFKDKIQFHRFT